MKGLFIILILSLLLTSCTWEEFVEDFSKIDQSLAGLFKKTPNEEIIPEKERISYCDSNDCLEDAFRRCSWTEGDFSDKYARTATLTIEPEEGRCKVTYQIKDSVRDEEVGKRFVCVVDKPNQRIDEFFVMENVACKGDIYDMLEPEVILESGEGIDVQSVHVTGTDVHFVMHNPEQIYFKKVRVTGPFFTQCLYNLKYPTKLPRKQTSNMSINCMELNGAGHRVFGNLLIDYYDTSEFKDLNTVNVSFVATKN